MPASPAPSIDPDRPLAPSRERVREHNNAFGFFGRLVLPLLTLQAKYEVHGGEKLPAVGPFILTPNHLSNYDPLVMGLRVWRLGRVPRFLAKSSLWKVPFLRWIMVHTGQIPVDRSGRTRGSDPVAAGKAAVAEGKGIIVYPEGSLTREPDLWPMRGKSGAVRIALESGVPLIPAAQWGAQVLMPQRSKRIRFFPRTHVTVAFGDPVDLSRWRGRHLEAHDYAEATAAVMASITELLATIRPGTPPAELYDPVKHNQTEIGRFE